MATCKKCHRFKTKKVLALHQKTCIPCKKDMEHYKASSSGKHSSNCDCDYCKKRRQKKN